MIQINFLAFMIVSDSPLFKKLFIKSLLFLWGFLHFICSTLSSIFREASSFWKLCDKGTEKHEGIFHRQYIYWVIWYSHLITVFGKFFDDPFNFIYSEFPKYELFIHCEKISQYFILRWDVNFNITQSMSLTNPSMLLQG